MSDEAQDGPSNQPLNAASGTATEDDVATRDEKIEQAKAKLESSEPTAIAAKDPSTPTKHHHAWWYRHLEPEERQRILVELGIKRQDHWGYRFATMLGLSVVVAVMGMSADSAAVVIGAMLLAPLMQPVLATAACIAMALFRKSFRSAGHVLIASIGSIALAYVLSSLFVNGGLPQEVTSRTAPDIRDLIVALGAGTAGAYATVRKDVSSSLPGVAVAVALVPPLAAVGITLEAGAGTLARGALLLYATNLVAIVFAASIVFVTTGFVPPRRLATTFRRSAAVSAVVAIAVIAIAIPLYRASLSAVAATDQQLEASAIVDDWLGPVTSADTPTVAFNDQRILVRVRSFEDPVDDRPLTAAMQARFGPERVVSLEWDKIERFEPTTSAVPTTTIISDSERLAADVEKIVDDWLQSGDFDGLRRVDSLVVADGLVRVDASGVGDAPSVQDLTDLLDEALDATLEVRLTWVERRNISSDTAPDPDEVVAAEIIALADEWAGDVDVAVVSVTYDGVDAIIEVAGESRPDATDLVDDIRSLLRSDSAVTVLFVQRFDITTVPTVTTAGP